MALATGVKATNVPVPTPEASAYGSQNNAFSSGQGWGARELKRRNARWAEAIEFARSQRASSNEFSVAEVDGETHLSEAGRRRAVIRNESEVFARVQG